MFSDLSDICEWWGIPKYDDTTSMVRKKPGYIGTQNGDAWVSYRRTEMSETWNGSFIIPNQ